MERSRGTGQVVFEGRILSVRVDPVDVPSGQSTREVVVKSPAVAVVTQVPEGLVIIRQYRWAMQEMLWELPAGVVEPNESAVEAIRRELVEEAGYWANTLQWVDTFYPSPGYSAERLDLYFTDDVHGVPRQPDQDEELEVHIWSRQTVLDHLARHEVKNGITLFGLNWWLRQHTATP